MYSTCDLDDVLVLFVFSTSRLVLYCRNEAHGAVVKMFVQILSRILFCIAELRSTLEADVRRSMLAAWAPGTLRNMQTQFDLFVKFCDLYDFQSMPASYPTLCAFAQFLSRSFKAPGSIKNYLVGVKWFHVLAGMETSQFDHVSLKLVLKGISRLRKHLPKQALPLTPEILQEIFAKLDHTRVDDVSLWTLLIFGFFLMARKSNLVPDSVNKFDQSRHLCLSDIILSENLVLVALKWSKTNQFGERQHFVPLLAMPDSVLCPVKAFKQHIKIVPKHPNGALFCRVDRGRVVPMTYTKFQDRLKGLIASTGRTPEAYSSHSLRRGGATFAAAAGVPRHYIQQVGDWKSDAVDQYLHNHLHSRVQAAQMMRQKICCSNKK